MFYFIYICFNVLGYGSEIQKKVHQKQEEEKKNVVRRSEEEIWQQAEILKEAELKKLREHLKVEHEKNIKKIRKGNEQALKVNIPLLAIN